MPLLQISVTGTDATGGTAAGTIEVEVTDPGGTPAPAPPDGTGTEVPGGPGSSAGQGTGEVRPPPVRGWMSVPPGSAAPAVATFPDPAVQGTAEPPASPPPGQAPQGRVTAP